MVTKDDAGKVEDAVGEVTPIVEAPPQPSVEELLGRLEEAGRKLEAAEQKAAAHERNVTKKSEELAKQRSVEKDIAELKTTVRVLADMTADLVDREGSDDEEPRPRRRKSEEYLSKLPKPGDKVQELTHDFSKQVEADSLARSVSLDVPTSPELRTAYLLFRVGDEEAGLKEVKQVVDARKAEATKGKETEAQMRERIRLDILKEQGRLEEDLGGMGSAGKKFTRKDLAEYNAKGKSVHDMMKDKDALLDQITK